MNTVETTRCRFCDIAKATPCKMCARQDMGLSDDEYERLPETESECRPIYDALPWTKEIIVNIKLPE